VDVRADFEEDWLIRHIRLVAPKLTKLRASCTTLSLDCPQLEQLTFLPSINNRNAPLEASSLENLLSLELPLECLKGTRIMSQCPNLQTLKVVSHKSRGGDQDFYMQFGEFLHQLPQRLRLLDVRGWAMEKLLPPTECPRFKRGGSRLAIRELRIGMAQRVSNYVTLRCLVSACSSLTRLQVSLLVRAVPDKESLSLFRTLLRDLDFQQDDIQVDIQ
jgi:hypothetical protein